MNQRGDYEVWLEEVEFRDWGFDVLDAPQGHFLQVSFIAPDAVTDEPSLQKGRKWYLSPHMVKSEFILTALKAVITAMEHEVREDFRYRGQAIFGPHVDVDALHDLAVSGGVEVRS